MNNCISKFIEKFKPGENLQKPDEEKKGMVLFTIKFYYKLVSKVKK